MDISAKIMIIISSLVGCLFFIIGYTIGKKEGTLKGWNDAYDANGRNIYPGEKWKGWKFKGK